MLSVAQSVPLAVAVSGANIHDSLALKPLIRGIPAVRSRRGPQRRRPVKLRADKAYFSAEHLAWLRERGIVARIARPGIESGERLGRHCWKIERLIAWLLGYRRLTVRYERKGSHFLAFLGLAAALTMFQRAASCVLPTGTGAAGAVAQRADLRASMVVSLSLLGPGQPRGSSGYTTNGPTGSGAPSVSPRPRPGPGGGAGPGRVRWP